LFFVDETFTIWLFSGVFGSFQGGQIQSQEDIELATHIIKYLKRTKISSDNRRKFVQICWDGPCNSQASIKRQERRNDEEGKMKIQGLFFFPFIYMVDHHRYGRKEEYCLMFE